MILVRDNIETSTSSATFHKIKYLTVDLGGNKITGSKGKLFNLSAVGDVAFESNITIKNGTLSSSHISNSPITFNSSNKTNVSAKFNVRFEGVTFASESTSGGNLVLVAFSNGTGGCIYEMRFDGCDFDATKGSVASLFGMADLGGNKFDIHVEVNGGTLIANKYFDLATFSPERTDGAGSPDSLVFGQDRFTLILPENAPAPGRDNVYLKESGVRCVFQEAYTDGKNKTYTLTPVAALDLNFTPKSSITLGSELVYNVYVPVTAELKSFTVNGKSYENLTPVTLDDGKSYYRIEVPMAAAKAAENIILSVTLTADGEDFTGTYTMSIPKYAKKSIANSTSTEEVTLVKDVLAYIRAAYVYFGSDNLTAVCDEIDSILAGYTSSFSKVAGDTNATAGLKGVITVLEAKPAVRFVLPKGVSADGYTFTQDERTLSYTTGSYTENGENYVYCEVELYAYQMIGEIEYTDGINSGKYHLNSYYDFVTTDDKHKDNESLIAVVEKLYNYCKSAESYRNAVTK